MGKHWSTEEDKILRANYRAIGPSGCSKIIRGRSQAACKHRAAALRLVEMSAHRVVRARGATADPTWILPKGRYPSVWHFADGVTA